MNRRPKRKLSTGKDAPVSIHEVGKHVILATCNHAAHQYPVQNWKCIGSCDLLCHPPPHSNPDFRRISTIPGSIFPAVPWALVSVFKSIAIPQEWVDSLAPVRCGRNEKQPPKLVICFSKPVL